MTILVVQVDEIARLTNKLRDEAFQDIRKLILEQALYLKETRQIKQYRTYIKIYKQLTYK